MTRWTTEVRTDREVFTELGDWWDSQPVVAENPFLSSAMLSCWEDGFDESGSRLHVRLLYRDGDLVAALPLYRSSGRLRTPSRAHTYSIDVVAVDDDEVREYLPIWLDQVPIVHLYRFREDSPLVGAVPDRPRWSIPSVLRCPYVDLSGGMEQVKSEISKEFARTLRRRRRRLEEMGPVRFVDHPDPGEVEWTLNEGLKLEAQGWKGREGVAVLSQPDNERWYRNVAEKAQDEGWLRLSALYLDDRMLAFRFDLQYGKRRYGQITSYDESRGVNLSTGSLLFELVLEQSAAEGLDTYELSFAGGRWKYDWTSSERLVYDLLIFGSGPLGRLLSRARRTKARGAR